MYVATIPLGFPLDKATDTITQVGWRATIKRTEVTIWEGDLRPISVPIVGALWSVDVAANQIIWEAPKVAGLNLVLTSVNKNDATGVITPNFSAGSSPELTSWDQAIQARNTVEGIDWAQQLFLAIMAAESPEGTNLEACVGGMLSINMDADVKIAYTPPVG